MTECKKQKNCILLYGDDPVAMSIRQREIIKDYFRGNPPDPVLFDGTGSYKAYRNQLEGQSLFSSEVAVILRNPFFLKRTPKTDSEKQALDEFLSLLETLPIEIVLVILVDGKIDRRTKVGKFLFSFCATEECSFMKPENAISLMIQILGKEGKTLNTDARVYLSEVIGAWNEISAPLIQTECDKIILMAGEEKRISRRLLEFALPEYMDQGVFRFMDSLLQKDGSAILRNTEHVFTDTTTTIKNIGFLASRFRKIKMVKEMERQGLPVSKMMNAIGVRNQWAWKALQKEAAKVSELDAEWFLTELFRYQYDMRKGNSESQLSDLILRFCLRR